MGGKWSVLTVLTVLASCIAADARPRRRMSALEAIQLRETMLKMYRLEPSACTALNGIPIVIGLIKEVASSSSADEVAQGPLQEQGWGGAYFTMSYLDAALGNGKLETGTYSKAVSRTGEQEQDGEGEEAAEIAETLHDTIDARAICLRKDMQYVFQLSRNPNTYEIGALVGKADFVGPDDAVHITTWDGLYKSRVKRHTSQFELEMAVKSIYTYAPAAAPPPPTMSPTPYPTWSRNPTSRPTNIRQDGQTSSCLESIPGYSVAWTLVDYCKIYTSSTCTAAHIKSFSCVPSYLQLHKACGATFCDVFSLLTNVCVGSQVSHYNLTNKHTIKYQDTIDGCLETFENKTYNATELTHVNWRVSLKLQGADSLRLASDNKAKMAIKAALCEFLPGVIMSSMTFETVEVLKITNAPSRSPSYVRVTQKTPQPTAMPITKEQLRLRLRLPKPPPTSHPTRPPRNQSNTFSPTLMPTRRLTRRPSHVAPPSPRPSPAPTYPPKSSINSTGLSITVTITTSIQSLGYSDEETAFEDASNNLLNAAATNALSFALREQSVHYNASAIKYAVVLKNDVMVTSLGTLPPASAPQAGGDAKTVDAGIIAGSTVATVAGIGLSGAAAYQAYKVLGQTKELVQVMPADQMQMLDVVPLKF